MKYLTRICTFLFAVGIFSGVWTAFYIGSVMVANKLPAAYKSMAIFRTPEQVLMMSFFLLLGFYPEVREELNNFLKKLFPSRHEANG